MGWKATDKALEALEARLLKTNHVTLEQLQKALKISRAEYVALLRLGAIHARAPYSAEYLKALKRCKKLKAQIRDVRNQTN